MYFQKIPLKHSNASSCFYFTKMLEKMQALSTKASRLEDLAM